MLDVLSENKFYTKIYIFSVQNSFYLVKPDFESYKKK